MNKKIARYIFMGICIVSAILLFTRIVDPIVGGIVFIIALIIFGGLSRGFKIDNHNTKKNK